MPYRFVVEIDLDSSSVHEKIELDSGIVSQDSFIHNNTLYLFGGSTGSGFSEHVYKIKNGKFDKI